MAAEEAVDAEIADPGLGAAIDDQLRHDGAGGGAELEAVQREAELVIEPIMARTRTRHGQLVGRARFDAGPGAHDGGVTHHWKQLEHGVLNNQCDIGFAEVPIALPLVRLLALPRVAVLPAGHRLASKATLQPRDFEGETFVSLWAGSTSQHLIDQVFHRDDVRRTLRVETTLPVAASETGTRPVAYHDLTCAINVTT